MTPTQRREYRDPYINRTSAKKLSTLGTATPGSVEPVRPWLTYPQAAAYCGWTVAHLRNLVSAGQIPVYGKPRVRRFRRDMLDFFLTDPDAAMRRFRAERNPHGS
jgi:hypothetical protein